MTDVWYAAYGSNTLERRFLHYLSGGAPSPDQAPHPGCRDSTPPSASAAATVPGSVAFAGRSRRWGGGVCHFVADSPSDALVRLWRITLEQFVDVQAQECGRPPGTVEVDLDAMGDGAAVENVDARYGTVMALGRRDDLPVLTFTGAPDEIVAPSQGYLGVMGRGLLETGFAVDRVVDYLCRLRGVAGRLDRPSVAAALQLSD